MILKRDEIKDVCSKILLAVDSSELSAITETLELIVKENILYLNVTNREYFVMVKIPVEVNTNFHATVNATLFLKLISQITTEDVELNVEDRCLVVKANGVYKLPLIYDNGELLKLPEINIENVTNEFSMGSQILHDILNYNSKELSKKLFLKLVQKYYYVDECGCITFTTGACVNNFTLPQPVKLLFNQKIVKLFKLFDGEISFTMGHNLFGGDVTQTVVKFENDKITLTAIISCDDTLINSVPVNVIRNMATDEYRYSVVLNKDEMLQSINRLLLFSSSGTFGKFDFTTDGLIMSFGNSSKENVKYCNDTSMSEDYCAVIDLNDLKLVLENCAESHFTINFGNSRSIVIVRNNIYNVIPEAIND